MAKTVSVTRDPLSGLVTTTKLDHDRLIVDYRQDVSKLLDRNARLRNDSDANLKAGVKSGAWTVATIPDSVVLKWKIEHGFDVFTAHPDEVAAMVNRPEYSYLKTTDKRF